MGHHLKKTTIITGTANEIGSRIGKFAMLVIIGEDKGQEELAKYADTLVNDPSVQRCILWLQTAEALPKLLENLSRSTQLEALRRQPYDDVLAFVISYKGNVVDIITSDDRINKLRVQKAFSNATQD